MSDVLVGIGLQLEDIKASQKRLEDAAEKAGQAFGKKLGDKAEESAGKSIAGLVAKIAAVVGTGALFKKMIDNAMESDRAVNTLNASMKVAGTFTQAASEQFQNYASTLQRTTGVSDDLIVQNGALLVSIGKLRGEGLERATKAALDLAATGRVEVGQAFDIMSKAATGATMGLNKFGIKVSDGIPEAERFAVALNQIEKAFGGLAQAKMNTFEGALTAMSNGFNDLLENVGKLFTHSPVLIAFIKEIAKTFSLWAEAIDKTGKSGDVIGDIIKKLLEIGVVMTEYVMPPFELLYNMGVFVFQSIVTGLDTIIAYLARVGQAYAKIGNMVGLVSDESYNTIKSFAESSGEVLVQQANKTSEAFGEMFNFDATAASQNFMTKMQEVADAAAPIVDTMKNNVNDALTGNLINVSGAWATTLDGMAAAAKKFAGDAQANFARIGQSMFQSLGNAAGQAFAAFGQAIAKGENALQAFLNSLIASMGQMAIQLGTQFILQGIAYMWAGMPNGPSLIAAGAALATFGGILAAVGGGGGGAAGGGAGAASGGGSASGSSMAETNIEEEDVADLERQKPQTNITVQVQGNVLDRRQTGLELAEVIQETFGTNGINYQT